MSGHDADSRGTPPGADDRPTGGPRRAASAVLAACGAAFLLALGICSPSLLNPSLPADSPALELARPRAVDLGAAGPACAWLGHAASSAIVAFLVTRLSGNALAGATSGLVFAAHPLHAECVAWSEARAIPFAAALALGACALWWFWRPASAWGAVRRGVALAMLALAGLLAPGAAFVPVCLWGALDIRGARRRGTAASAMAPGRNWPLMLVALLAVFAGVLRTDLPRRPMPTGPEGFAAWLDSLGSMVVPWRLLPDYAALYADAGALSVIWGVGGLVAIGLVARKLGRRVPALMAGFWWAILAMTLSLGVDHVHRADWALYVASVGFAWAAGEAIALLPARAAVPVATLVLALYGTKSVFQQRAWNSPDSVLAQFESLPDAAQGELALRYARLGEAKEQDAWRLARRAEVLDAEGRRELASALRERASRARLEASRFFRRSESALLRRESAGPLDARAIAARGEVAFRAGDYARAKELLADSSGKLPSARERSHALFMLGEIASRAASDAAAAAAHYKDAIAADPSNADAHFRLGAVLAAMGKTEEAIEAYRRAASLRPHDAAFQNSLGAIFERALRFEDAERAYAKAVQVEPDREDYRADLEAVRRMIKGRKIDPAGAQKAFQEGEALEAQGRLTDAVESYRRAIALSQGNHAAHYRAGVCLAAYGSGLRKFDERRHYLSQAIEHFRAATVLRPGEETYLFALAQAHSDLGQVSDAEEVLRAILSANPRSGVAHLRLARLYAHALEDVGRAREELRKAEELGAKPTPEFLKTLEEIEAEKAAGPPSEEETAALEKAAAATGEGDILLGNGEPSSAADSYARAYEILAISGRRSFVERRARAAAQAAAAYEKAGRLAEALEWYRRALALAPASALYAREFARLELVVSQARAAPGGSPDRSGQGRAGSDDPRRSGGEASGQER